MSLEGDSPTSGQTRASSEEPTDSSKMSSPRPARKRTIDEMYTCDNQRPNTAPEESQKTVQSSHFAKHGFLKDLPNPAAQSFGSTIATLSTQASDASTAITAPDAPQTFVSQLQALHVQLDRQYDEYVEELKGRDHKAQLEPFDWDVLEEAYARDIEPATRDEQQIQMELANCYKNMLFWMQTTSDREAQRAIKRLRTRIAFVQTSEHRLAQKEAHYQKVLNAFQSTMALFGGL